MHTASQIEKYHLHSPEPVCPPHLGKVPQAELAEQIATCSKSTEPVCLGSRDDSSGASCEPAKAFLTLIYSRFIYRYDMHQAPAFQPGIKANVAAQTLHACTPCI